ncbi:MAG: acyloxyacyl hydrolase, partial [Bacteroidota bacterium]
TIHPDFPTIKSNGLLLNIKLSFDEYQAKSFWAQVYNKPQISLNLDYITSGNKSIGNFIGLIPQIGIELNKTNRETVFFNFGLGLGIATNPFNKATNPENNVVGSSLSIYVKPSINYNRKISERFYLTSAISIHHFSNGNFVSPNIGANQLSISIGASMNLNKNEIGILNDNNFDSPSFDNKIFPFIRAGLGLKEVAVDGPKFPIYLLALGIKKKTTLKDQWSFGVEYLVNYADIHFMKSTFAFEGEEFNKASRWLIFLGHDFLYRKFAFTTELGYYTSKHYDKRSSFSSKIGIKYISPKIRFANFHLESGLFVRAKLLEAEFIEWTSSINF